MTGCRIPDLDTFRVQLEARQLNALTRFMQREEDGVTCLDAAAQVAGCSLARGLPVEPRTRLVPVTQELSVAQIEALTARPEACQREGRALTLQDVWRAASDHLISSRAGRAPRSSLLTTRGRRRVRRFGRKAHGSVIGNARRRAAASKDRRCARRAGARAPAHPDDRPGRARRHDPHA